MMCLFQIKHLHSSELKTDLQATLIMFNEVGFGVDTGNHQQLRQMRGVSSPSVMSPDTRADSYQLCYVCKHFIAYIGRKQSRV